MSSVPWILEDVTQKTIRTMIREESFRPHGTDRVRVPSEPSVFSFASYKALSSLIRAYKPL